MKFVTGKVIPKNKFEMLSSRVIRCGVELRRQKMKEKGWVVKCFKCGKCKGTTLESLK